jgi:hypothetical protein
MSGARSSAMAAGPCWRSVRFASGAGQIGLAAAPTLPFYIAAWLIIGFGMGAGLYDAAFGTLGRLYGRDAGAAITRMVYPVARFRLELAADFETRILSLETPDGFNVSFGLTQAQCRELAEDHPCESEPKLRVN